MLKEEGLRSFIGSYQKYEGLGFEKLKTSLTKMDSHIVAYMNNFEESGGGSPGIGSQSFGIVEYEKLKQ